MAGRRRPTDGASPARLCPLSLWLSCCALLLLLHPPPVLSKKPVPRSEDVPLIKCQVCQHIAANALRQTQDLRKRTAPKKVSELKVLEITEKICNPKKDQGDWIQWIDIVEAGDVLELKRQRFKGECGEECKTIEKACNEVIGFVDTDVAELLHTRPDITPEEAVDELCRGITDACKKGIPKVPKGRKPGPAFVQKSEHELERERMERNIEGKQDLFAEEHPDAPRMPKMKLYSRDDLMKKNMVTGKEGEDDEDDDDEDEEETGSGAKGEGSAPQDEQLRAIREAMRKAEERSREASREPKPKTPLSKLGAWLDGAKAKLTTMVEEAVRAAKKAYQQVQAVAKGPAPGKKKTEKKTEL